MSKTPRSSSRTHSRSASRSRSGSDSRSRSRSRSSSQSRSRKHRYGCRSRSRSRSHSPFHNRGRKHPRENQNHREFRGYHRGFRRPYYFRGRGRGFFRGHFQRGGGGYNNYRSNNWQYFGQYPQQKQQKQYKHQQVQQQQQQQQQQKQHAHSPKRGRSRTPKKCSSSPQSLSHSHRSDRSTSQHSHHSSSSSSSRQITPSVKQNCKAGIEILSVPKESQKAGGGETTLQVQGGHHPEVDTSISGEKSPKTWLFPINHDNSQKKASPHIYSAVSAVQDDPASSESGPVPGNSGATSNGATSTPSNSSPQKKSPMTVFSGFGLFSNADQEEDTVAISVAFKKFLEEQKNKKQTLADKSMENVADNGNPSPQNRNSNCEGTFDRSSGPRLSRSADQNNKKESEKYKYIDNFKGNTLSTSFRPAILSEDGEEEEGEDTESHVQMRVLENEVPNRKGKVAMSARELFEEHFRRLDNRSWDDELEAFLINREKERTASILSALSKREKITRKFEDLSPERPLKVKRMDKMTSSPSPTYKALSRRSSETQEQEFMNLGDESSPRTSGKREREFSLRMDSLSEDLARSSVLSNDWRNTMDLVHCDKKGHHQRWCNNSCRSPTELFAQHVISIVHYVTAQHFSSSGMTLSDRFSMYQRLAAEKEIMKPRKSPEIHRRIDVSPSTFMRHSFLFDELKGSGESSSKGEVKQLKGDTMDLPMNVEKRKKYLSRETNEKQEERGELGHSPESSMESSTEKSSKCHKTIRKSKKRQEHSHSSCSSSSSFVHEEETESTEKTSAPLQARECVASADTGQACGRFQFQIRGRGWNRVNCLGNDSKCNSNAHVSGHSNNMDWDSEQMAKSKKYYLLDEKDAEGERKWVDTPGCGQSAIPRVKGRFILRRPTISITTNNSNWSHDKFKASGDNSEPGNRDHKAQNSA